MTTVTVTRQLDHPPDTIRSAILDDVEAFIEASGFDEVWMDEDRYVVSKDIGLATFELTLAPVEDPDAVLALDQVDGIFEEMWTEYTVEPSETGCAVTATTEFTLGSVLAPILEPTMIRVQRTREFEDQFDYLEAVTAFA
ncbi:MAG: SRPBCC family protein [Halodesulfurarchaeum sp.]